MNPLYERGYWRVGCILCPMATTKEKFRHIRDYPKYAMAYLRAFAKMFQEGVSKGKTHRFRFDNPVDLFKWWVNENYNPNQLTLEEMDDYGRGDRQP